jgi:hypothetical protein
MDRRSFLRLAGGGVVLAAAPACAPAGPDPAAAWTQAGQSADPRVFALSYALLAPNPHNRQPWLARLDGADGISLFVDRERLLPVTDPFSRQILIGCGAFLELLATAATARGRRAEVTPWPEGEPGDRLDARPFASVRLAGTDGAPDPLFKAIPQRRSNKEAYDKTRAPAADALNRLTREAAAPGQRLAFTTDPARVAQLRSLVKRAHVREIETPAALQESVDLMRIGRREVAAHRDGIDLSGFPMEAAAAVGLLTREKLAQPGSMVFEQGKTLYDAPVASTNGFIWLISEGNTRSTQLASGRAYARLNLAATAAGLAMHPMSQALQEYREIADLKAEADRLTGVRPGERLQMLARIGYGRPVPPSPRRGLSEHLIA